MKKINLKLVLIALSSDSKYFKLKFILKSVEYYC